MSKIHPFTTAHPTSLNRRVVYRWGSLPVLQNVLDGHSLRAEVGNAYLDESNVCGLLSEALTADVEAILADKTGLVGADTARIVRC